MNGENKWGEECSSICAGLRANPNVRNPGPGGGKIPGNCPNFPEFPPAQVRISENTKADLDYLGGLIQDRIRTKTTPPPPRKFKQALLRGFPPQGPISQWGTATRHVTHLDLGPFPDKCRHAEEPPPETADTLKMRRGNPINGDCNHNHESNTTQHKLDLNHTSAGGILSNGITSQVVKPSNASRV